MFNSKLKKEVERLGNIIDILEKNLRDIKAVKEDSLVECKTCGCILKKETAIKGKSRIEKVPIFTWSFITRAEVIVNDFYCKVHAPKNGKKVTGK